MTPPDSFGLLRTILRTLGLALEAIDDIVARIADFLGGYDQIVNAPLRHTLP